MATGPTTHPAMTALPPNARSGDAALTRAPGGVDGDRAFAGATLAAALAVPAILLAVFLLLAIDAEPALTRFGASFVTSSTWDNVKEQFGTLPYIYGTVVTSLLALVLATPVGLGAALFITEYGASSRSRR
ncbi:MAG: hypothetical protein EBS89_01115 [Proteobacteria bacterium]|nr:hypothetical protein [Pseudomonadota bacterium]